METTKYTFLDFGDAVLEYEIVGDVLVLHANVRNWTHNSFKLMKGVFDLFIADAIEQGYRKMVTVTPNPKFAKLFGGEVFDHMVINDQYVEVIKWELKQH